MLSDLQASRVKSETDPWVPDKHWCSSETLWLNDRFPFGSVRIGSNQHCELLPSLLIAFEANLVNIRLMLDHPRLRLFNYWKPRYLLMGGRPATYLKVYLNVSQVGVLPILFCILPQQRSRLFATGAYQTLRVAYSPNEIIQWLAKVGSHSILLGPKRRISHKFVYLCGFRFHCKLLF